MSANRSSIASLGRHLLVALFSQIIHGLADRRGVVEKTPEVGLPGAIPFDQLPVVAGVQFVNSFESSKYEPGMTRSMKWGSFRSG